MRDRIVASSRGAAFIITIATPKRIIPVHAAYNCRLLAPPRAHNVVWHAGRSHVFVSFAAVFFLSFRFSCLVRSFFLSRSFVLFVSFSLVFFVSFVVLFVSFRFFLWLRC